MVLKTHRQGNDFKLTLQVYRLNDAISVTTDTVPDGAIPEDLTEAQNIKLSLYCSTGACTILKKTVNVNTIVAEIPTNIQDIGTYFVLLEYDVVDISFADGLKRITVDFDAFKIVCKSAYADTEGDMSLIGVIKVGLDGKSAYQYAQEHGYTGTEEEFGQLQYEATLAAINEVERIIAESNREQTFNTQMDAVDTAIGLAGTATDNANMAATNANDKAILANNAATNADSKAQLAETATSNADTATILANNAATNADSKSQSAETATSNADIATGLANNAATNADNKAGLADQKATLANNAAIAANTATGNANTATANANSAALAANSLAGTYNVTVAIPLGAGLYYTSTTARAAVPTTNRLLGRVITYATASGIWYSERYIGTDVINWTVVGNWDRVPDNSQIVQLGADLSETTDKLTDLEDELGYTANVVKVTSMYTNHIIDGINLYPGVKYTLIIELDTPATTTSYFGFDYGTEHLKAGNITAGLSHFEMDYTPSQNYENAWIRVYTKEIMTVNVTLIAPIRIEQVIHNTENIAELNTDLAEISENLDRTTLLTEATAAAVGNIDESKIREVTDSLTLNPANILNDATFAGDEWEFIRCSAVYQNIDTSLSKKAILSVTTEGTSSYFFSKTPKSLFEDGRQYLISVIANGATSRLSVRKDSGIFIFDGMPPTASKELGDGYYLNSFLWTIDKSQFSDNVHIMFKSYYSNSIFIEPFVGLADGNTNYAVVKGEKIYVRRAELEDNFVADDNIYPDSVKRGKTIKLAADMRLSPIGAKEYDGDYLTLAFIEYRNDVLSSLLHNGEYGLIVSSTPSLLYKDENGDVTIDTDVVSICSKTFKYAGTYFRCYRDKGEGGYNEWFFTEYRKNKGYNSVIAPSMPRLSISPNYSGEVWDWTKDVNNRYTIMEQVYEYMDELLLANPSVVKKIDPMATANYTEGGITIYAMPEIRNYMVAHGFSNYPFWYDGCDEGDYDIVVGNNNYHAHLKATPRFRPFIYVLSKSDLWRATRSNSHQIKRRNLYVQGGIHGEEPMGSVAVAHLMKELLGDTMGAYSVLANYDVFLFPVLDGYNSLHGSYNGAYGTNANRNYPTPWWRAESNDWGKSAGDYLVTRLSCAFIDTLNPDVAFDVHDQLATVTDLGYCSSGFHHTGNQFYQLFAETANAIRHTQRYESHFGTKNQIPPFRVLTERMNASHAHDYFFYKGIRSGGLLEVLGGINYIAQSDGGCIYQRTTENDYSTDSVEIATLIVLNYVFGMCEYDMSFL